MNVETRVEPLEGALPGVAWRWDPETDILSGGFRAIAGGRGLEGSVELSDDEGSVIVLDVAGGVVCGLDVVVWPEVDSVPGLAPPAAARLGRVVVPGRPARPGGLGARGGHHPVHLGVAGRADRPHPDRRPARRRGRPRGRSPDRGARPQAPPRRLLADRRATLRRGLIPPPRPPYLPSMSDLIGRVVATELRPSTPHQFHFWTARESPVGIGALVRVEAPGRVVFGVVTEAVAYADSGGGAGRRRRARGDPPLHRRRAPPGARGAAAAGPARRGAPRDRRRRAHGAPDGRIHRRRAPDRHSGRHLRRGGPRRAGVPRRRLPPRPRGGASQHHRRLGARHQDQRGGVPALEHLPDLSGAQGLGRGGLLQREGSRSLLPRPARRRSAPRTWRTTRGSASSRGRSTRSATSRPASRMASTSTPSAPIPTSPATPSRSPGDSARCSSTRRSCSTGTTSMPRPTPSSISCRIVSWARNSTRRNCTRRTGGCRASPTSRPSSAPSSTSLESGGRGDIWRTHHIATIRKVRNRLGNITTRAKGLVADDGAANDLPWGAFADRGVYVVDVAGVDPLAQDLVFARVVSKLREHLERRDLGVDHVVVFVDELNKYAPADGQDTYVRKMLLDLSERGRYLGLVLFSAQQFRSQVLRRVVGNAGTSIFGRMDMEELATAGYATLSPAIKVKLATLPKGELMIRHPHFTQPVFARFPRPAVLSGREGVERFPPGDRPPVRRRGGPPAPRAWTPPSAADRVKAAIHGRREDDVRRALRADPPGAPRRRPGVLLTALGRRVEPEIGTRRAGIIPLASEPATLIPHEDHAADGARLRSGVSRRLAPRSRAGHSPTRETRPPRRPAPRLPPIPSPDLRRHQPAGGRRRRGVPPRRRWRDRGAPGRDRRRGRSLPFRPPDQRGDRLRLPAVPAAARRRCRTRRSC